VVDRGPADQLLADLRVAFVVAGRPAVGGHPSSPASCSGCGRLGRVAGRRSPGRGNTYRIGGHRWTLSSAVAVLPRRSQNGDADQQARTSTGSRRPEHPDRSRYKIAPTTHGTPQKPSLK
jgi:hypothetical protein